MIKNLENYRERHDISVLQNKIDDLVSLLYMRDIEVTAEFTCDMFYLYYNGICVAMIPDLRSLKECLDATLIAFQLVTQ